ncbi:MAG: FMN-binding negative transcriptional regulator [Bacteroidetes bacterium]|nr:FMN-binding negative transcriptional regulator [Bacteroidota bacterium]
MYIPPQFAEQDTAEIEKLVREFSFATLVSLHNGKPWATHIPLHLHIHPTGEWYLHGHIARANPQWKNFEGQPDVLAIFMGPHSYVSPSWYNHKNVPTWNYLAAHLYGPIRVATEEESEQMLRSLMAHYENKHAEKPQGFDEIPSHTLEKDLRGVVCFEIKVGRVEATRKLSQNRDAESHASVIAHLKKTGEQNAQRIAAAMEKNKNQ